MPKKYRTAIPSIRKWCIECSGGSFKEVRLCPSKNCPLYLFRMGKRPTQAEIDAYEKSCDENK